MRTRTVFLGLLLFCLLASLGCSRPEPVAPAHFTLLVPSWYAPDKLPALQTALAAWPNVEAKVLVGKRDAIFQKILLGAKRGDFADAVLARNEWIGPLVEAGALRPLPPEAAELVRGQALPALLPAVSDRQSVWAVPFDADVMVLWYRRDLAAAAGVTPPTDPAQWDLNRLAEMARRLQGEARGFAFSAQRYPNAALAFLPWYFAQGGDLADESGRLRLEAPQAAAALAWLQSLIQAGACPSGVAGMEQNDVFNGLAGGAYAMAVGGSWDRGMLEKQSAFAGRMASLPVPRATLIGGWSLVLPAGGKPGCLPLLTALFAAAVQRDKLTQSGWLPVRQDLLDDPWFAASPDGPAFRQSLAIGRALPLHPRLNAALDEIATMLAEVFLEKAKSEQAAAAAAAKIAGLN